MPAVQIREIVCNPGQKANGFLEVAEKPGSKVTMPVMIANGIKPGPTICLVGAAHATEYCGVFSIIRLMNGLDTSHLTGAVIAVPVLNMPGFEVIEAFNPIDGLQPLAVFPGSPHETVTHRIAHTFIKEVVSRSDYVIDMHGGGRATEHMENTIYKILGDKKVDEASEGMARHYLLEHVNPRKMGKTSILDVVLRMGKPGMVVEIGGEGKVRESLVEMNIRGLTNVLRYLKILTGNPQAPPQQKVIRRVERLTSNRGGLIFSRKRASEPMKKGEILGEVMDIFGNVIETITAPFDGVIYAVYDLLPINSGDMAYMVARYEGDLFYTGGGYAGYREIVYRPSSAE